MAAINAGREVSRTLQLTAHDLLTATRATPRGDGYRRLRDAFERLAGTRITTNITTGGVEVTHGFGLIESWRSCAAPARGAWSGLGDAVGMALRAALSKSVLSLNRDYFRMRKPLERRIYELARKHCGRQDQWRVSVEVLHRKSGSASPRRVFRAMLREMIAADPLPDYHLEEEPGDILRVTPRDAVIEAAGRPMLAPATYEAAREMLPGWDVYALEAEWRAWWVATGRAVGHEAREDRHQPVQHALQPCLRHRILLVRSDQRRQPDQGAVGRAARDAVDQQVELGREIPCDPALTLLEPVIDHHPVSFCWMIARLMLKGVSVPMRSAISLRSSQAISQPEPGRQISGSECRPGV
jgi:hypothetical protein